ncbi:MAG: ABC transporter ATP-binding protein [Gammaproteobacteria bacterium]|nr:ABC transporter ATP-binding protein [Gammaproteobacteria bacterium]
MTTLLKLDDVKIAYGGIQAVKGISLHVNEGELVALIGANGAGKTTTLKAIAGLLKPSHGDISYNGKPIVGLAPHEIATRRMALVPEGRGVFPGLTIHENLQMGAYIRRDFSEIQRDIELAYTRFPRLKERAKQTAGTLSGGEQQMLAISRALMLRPKLLLLDEPSMGLAPIMVQKIFAVVNEVAAAGVTVLLIEQNAKLALQVSQRAYVMDGGIITLEGESRLLLHDARIREAYLGEAA